jgi:hypothetical protein
MRRRAAGLTLAGLAVVCAASAVVLGGRIAGQLTERPLNGRETVTLTAARASYVSPARLTEITGAAMEVTDTITAAASTGYPAIAIWDVHRSVYDTTNHQQFEPMSRTVVFDRKTAELVNCCGGSIDGNGLIWQDGIAGYAFPVGTRKQAYSVFDAVLDKPEPVAYSGTDMVNGIPAYRFTEEISAANAGFSPLSSSEPELYSMDRVYWVDPETGTLLKVTENEDLYLVNAATGATVTHLFDANLRTTPATVGRLASQDARSRDEIALMARARLAALGTAGGLALLAGCLLAGPLLARSLRAGARRLRRSRSPGGQ